LELQGDFDGQGSWSITKLDAWPYAFIIQHGGRLHVFHEDSHTAFVVRVMDRDWFPRSIRQELHEHFI
jgi:hypothetical protein